MKFASAVYFSGQTRSNKQIINKYLETITKLDNSKLNKASVLEDDIYKRQIQINNTCFCEIQYFHSAYVIVIVL